MHTNNYLSYFFFNDTASTEIYTLSLHDALPIAADRGGEPGVPQPVLRPRAARGRAPRRPAARGVRARRPAQGDVHRPVRRAGQATADRAGPGAPAGRAVPGRADRRARPA